MMQSSFQRRGRRFQKKQAAADAGVVGASAANVDASLPGPSSSSSSSSLDAVAPRVDVAAPVAGTRPGLHGQTLVSTGLADLDNLLGGGLPLGTVMMLGTDGDPSSVAGNACTLLRYFVAEGCASGHVGMWIHPEAGGARSIARSLPRVVVDKSHHDDDETETDKPNEPNGDADDGLRIAWQYRRYLRQGKALDDGRVGGQRDGLGAGVSTSGGANSSSRVDPNKRRKNDGGVRRLPTICHGFDLTREADPAAVDAADLTCVAFRHPPSLAVLGDGRIDGLEGDYSRAYEKIRAFVEDVNGRGGEAVGRLAIHPGTKIDEDTWRATCRFLRALRGLLRGTRVCAVCVLASSAKSRSHGAALRHNFDACVDVESLPQAPCAMEQMLPDPLLCVGLVHARRIAFPGVVGASPLMRMDPTYALQLRRRRMAIAPLQLSPEDATSTRPGGVSRSNLTARGDDGGNQGTAVKKSASGGLCGGGPSGDPRNDPLDF